MRITNESTDKRAVPGFASLVFSSRVIGRLARFRTVKNRLILYALSMLIPIMVFCIIYLVQSQNIWESKAGNLASESLGMSMSWMDEVLAGGVRLSAAVESDRMLREFLTEQQDTDLSQTDVLTILKVEERLAEFLGTEKRAASIWVYFSATGEVISTKYGHYRVSDRKGLELLQSRTSSGPLRTWIYPEGSIGKDAGSLMDLTGFVGLPYVTFARAIPAIGTEKDPVIVGVGYLQYTVQDILNDVSNNTNTALLLLDSKGKPVYTEHPAAAFVYPAEGILQRLHTDDENSNAHFIYGNWMVASSTSTMTGWQVVSVAPLQNFMGGLRLLTLLTLSFAASALLFALFTARSLTKSILRPLRQVLLGMRRMEAGDLAVRIRYDRPDEFHLLADGFNRMIETQDNLIRTVYRERIAKQQAELNYLSSQINPHFLYNTLGALYAMAKKSDETLAAALLDMSRLFRLSLNRGKETMTVEESVQQIVYYIRLLDVRNPGKYRLETYVEPGAEKLRIPLLLIQPLVENAVRHGLEPVGGPGVIRVSVTLLKRDILIMIYDNGKGMDEHTLSRLRNGLQPDGERESAAVPGADIGHDDGSGYALGNIYQRLTLKYGERFSFKIESEPDKGTTVALRIPLYDETEEEA